SPARETYSCSPLESRTPACSTWSPMWMPAKVNSHFPCDLGADAGASYPQSCHPGLFPAIVTCGDVITEPGRFMVAVKHRADGKMGAHFVQVDHSRFYKLFVDLRAIAVFGNVALRAGQNLQKLGFKLQA